MQSAVGYDVGYDTKKIKKRKNITVRLWAAIEDKNCSKIQIAQKISRFRSTLPYLSSEYRNLRHTIPLTISMATTVSNHF